MRRTTLKRGFGNQHRNGFETNRGDRMTRMTGMKDALRARRPSSPITPGKVAAQPQQGPAHSMAGMRWAAYGACALAFGHAGVSAYWALGGTGGLDTVGGFAERWARSRARPLSSSSGRRSC